MNSNRSQMTLEWRKNLGDTFTCHFFVLTTRSWRIMLPKVAYYGTSSARNFAKLCQNSQIMLLIYKVHKITKWRRFFTITCQCEDAMIYRFTRHDNLYRRTITTPNYEVFQISCRCKFICVLWQFVPALSCPSKMLDKGRSRGGALGARAPPSVTQKKTF